MKLIDDNIRVPQNILDKKKLHRQTINYYCIAEKEDILKLHPDLAGRLSDLGKLTAESSNEQKSAGLNQIATEQKEKLSMLNLK